MRALMISLAAAGFAICSLAGYAGDELSRERLEQPGRTADDEPKLKSAGASSKAARAIDEDSSLKSTGPTARPNRAAADDEPPLKSAGGSRKAGRAIDEDAPLKSTSVPKKVGRAIDEDAPLKSAGASSKAERTLDEDTPLKSVPRCQQARPIHAAGASQQSEPQAVNAAAYAARKMPASAWLLLICSSFSTA